LFMHQGFDFGPVGVSAALGKALDFAPIGLDLIVQACGQYLYSTIARRRILRLELDGRCLNLGLLWHSRVVFGLGLL